MLSSEIAEWVDKIEIFSENITDDDTEEDIDHIMKLGSVFQPRVSTDQRWASQSCR